METHAEVWAAIRSSGLLEPLVPFLREYVATVDVNKRSLIVEDACEWLASQIGERAGFDLVSRVTALLRTREGEAFIRLCLYRSEPCSAS